MDGYLHYVKTLRSQINDVEDQAAKISVEEQMRITAIHTLETDLVSAKSQTGRLKEETNQMVKEKNRICSQILAKQKRIATLESDSSTLTQTLELIQQERVSLSAKVIEKRSRLKLMSKQVILKSELRAMDMKNMEEEYNALLSDKAGEAEYLHSLQGQIEKLKGLSHKIKCACGTEYKVGLELCV